MPQPAGRPGPGTGRPGDSSPPVHSRSPGTAARPRGDARTARPGPGSRAPGGDRRAGRVARLRQRRLPVAPVRLRSRCEGPRRGGPRYHLHFETPAHRGGRRAGSASRTWPGPRVSTSPRRRTGLEQSLREDQVVFVRGGIGTGRRASATVVLDRLTGRSRRESKVTVLETTSGLAELPDRLEPGCGHLLDASEANLGRHDHRGADHGGPGGASRLRLPGHPGGGGQRAVAARPRGGPLMPDLAEVWSSSWPPGWPRTAAPDTGELDTRPARALIAEACHGPRPPQAWHEEITRPRRPARTRRSCSPRRSGTGGTGASPIRPPCRALPTSVAGAATSRRPICCAARRRHRFAAPAVVRDLRRGPRRAGGQRGHRGSGDAERAAGRGGASRRARPPGDLRAAAGPLAAPCGDGRAAR